MVQHFSKLFSILVIACTFIISCSSREDFIGVLQPAGNVYTQDGLVSDYVIDIRKPRFVQFYTPGGLASEFYDKFLLPGQIDKIIEDHPEWEFVYYVDCKDSNDLDYLISILKKYDEKWRAIVYFNQEFQKAYGLKDGDRLSSQGFFWAHDNVCLGSPMRDLSGRYINHYIERYNKQYRYK